MLSIRRESVGVSSSGVHELLDPSEIVVEASRSGLLPKKWSTCYESL
jgi:hypothetical protein